MKIPNEDYGNHIAELKKWKTASMTSEPIYSNYLVKRSQMSSTTQSKVNFVWNIYTILEWKHLLITGSCHSWHLNAGFSVWNFKPYHINEENVKVMFKFVNFNKLAHN